MYVPKKAVSTFFLNNKKLNFVWVSREKKNLILQKVGR